MWVRPAHQCSIMRNAKFNPDAQSGLEIAPVTYLRFRIAEYFAAISES